MIQTDDLSAGLKLSAGKMFILFFPFWSRRMGLSFGSREFIRQPQKPRIATPRFKALSVLEVAFPPEAALG